MPYESTIPAVSTKPRTQYSWSPRWRGLVDLLLVSCSLTTWMLVGGCVQALLMLSAGRRYIVLGLPFVFLLLRIVNGLLIHYGYLKNPYMQGVYLGRRTALVPNEQGVIEEDGSKKEKVVVFLLGAKSNHPLGFYSPKFLQMALWLTKMNGQFCSTDQPNGFLGQTMFTRKDERGGLEFIFLSYWRSLSDLHEFAHAPLHRDSWLWWEKGLKEHDVVGISHEVYEAAPGHFENAYVNFQPTALGGTTYLRRMDGKFEGGELKDEWVSPLVDAKRGRLASMSGRLGWAPTAHDGRRPGGEATKWA